MRAVTAFLSRHRLVHLFFVHASVGFTAAAFFVGALLAFDVGGLKQLVAAQSAWPFMGLLWLFAGLTFASVQMGVAVMALRDDSPPGGGKRQRVQGGALATVPVQKR